VRALAKRYPAYLERPDENPHLRGLLTGAAFDAAANQTWFLDKMARFINSSRAEQTLVLDQDPAGIVFGYAKMFFDDEKMTAAQYGALLERLSLVEESLRKWRSPRLVLFLDAPVEVLRNRISQRWGPERTPSLQWFKTVRAYFENLTEGMPNITKLSTAAVSQAEVVTRAIALLEGDSARSQA
jgi:deoxyadenosine/deoxycytidine kinase